MKDAYGYDIKAGDIVVCAQRRGSSCWVTTCDVLRVDEAKGPVLRKVSGNTDSDLVYGKPYYYKSKPEAIMIVRAS